MQFSLRWMFVAVTGVAVTIVLLQQGYFACVVALILGAGLIGSVHASRNGGSAVIGGVVAGGVGGLIGLILATTAFYAGVNGAHTDEALVGGFLFTAFVHVVFGGISGFAIGCGVSFAASVLDVARGPALPEAQAVEASSRDSS